MTISRRSALIGASAAVVVAGVSGAVQGEDAELITLGRQWLATYGKWLRPTCGSKESGLLKKVCAIEDLMADIPARSHDGALVKLRVAVEHYRLMGDIDCDPYARLAYQAWQGLETEPVNFGRLMGEVAS